MTRLKLSVILLISILIYSCSDDDGGNNDANLTYELSQTNNSGVSGNAVFTELQNGDIQLTISLNNIEADANHPAHIHYNSAEQGGGIYVDLNNIKGATQESVTVFNEDIEGNALNFNDISNLDAHINVHQNPDNLDLIAKGDIGNNVSSSSDNNDGGGSY